MSKDTPQSKESFNILPAEFGGYLVTKPGYHQELITNIYFAGELDDCLDFIREQYEPVPVMTEADMKDAISGFEEGDNNEQIKETMARHTEAAIKELLSMDSPIVIHVGSYNGEFPFNFTVRKTAADLLREAWADPKPAKKD